MSPLFSSEVTTFNSMSPCPLSSLSVLLVITSFLCMHNYYSSIKIIWATLDSPLTPLFKNNYDNYCNSGDQANSKQYSNNNSSRFCVCSQTWYSSSANWHYFSCLPAPSLCLESSVLESSVENWSTFSPTSSSLISRWFKASTTTSPSSGVVLLFFTRIISTTALHAYRKEKVSIWAPNVSTILPCNLLCLRKCFWLGDSHQFTYRGLTCLDVSTA